jgi:heme/copper-type cytochrome/quinol oxidase subunit 3
MIQRIQSIYILIVAALFGSLFFIPISKLVIENEIVTLNLQQLSIQSATQSETIQTLFPTLTLAILIIILAFVTLFLYKNRGLQMRLISYNTILISAIFILFAYYIYKITIDYSSNFSFSIGFIIPIIAIIFNILAYRRIKRDDELVKSIDRIR